MTIEEIKKALAENQDRKKTLSEHVKKTNDIEHVRSMTKELEAVNEEIDRLNGQLIAVESGTVPRGTKAPGDAKLENADIVRAMFSGNSSFHYANGSSASSKMTSDQLALRSDETLFSRLPAGERKPLDLGKCIRGMVTGDWSGALEERTAINTTSAGVLIPAVLSAQIIDKARNISLFSSAGVPIVPMITNNLTIARVKTDPVFAFKEELAEATESSFELEPVELKAKTAYGYAYCSLETIRSASNLTEILYKVFSQAFADMCDKAMLYGQTSNNTLADYAPSGVLNDADINSITASNVGFSDFVKGIGAIKRANGIPTVVGMNAATEEQLALLTDANGNVLMPPEAFAKLAKVISNQLAEDETDGSDALVFDPAAMIIGVQNNITIKMITDSDYCIKHGAVGFQIYAMLDCAVTQPKHITKISGIKEIVASNNSND